MSCLALGTYPRNLPHSLFLSLSHVVDTPPPAYGEDFASSSGVDSPHSSTGLSTYSGVDSPHGLSSYPVVDSPRYMGMDSPHAPSNLSTYSGGEVFDLASGLAVKSFSLVLQLVPPSCLLPRVGLPPFLLPVATLARLPVSWLLVHLLVTK